MLITLVGPNRFSKLREIHKLTAQHPVVRLYGEDGMRLWYEEVGQVSLFGDARAVVGERIVEDMSKENQERLAEHLASQNVADDTQVVLMIVETEAGLKKSPMAELLLSHRVMKFPEPTAAQAGMWLMQEAEAMGVQIAKDAISAMVTKYAGEQYALKSELHRWAVLENPKITRDDVDTMVPLQVEVNNFDVVNSWSVGQISKAMTQLIDLRRQGIPDQAIVGSFAWKIESMLVGEKFGRRWTRELLERAMRSLYELDLKTKTGEIEPGLGLEVWMVESAGVDLP